MAIPARHRWFIVGGLVIGAGLALLASAQTWIDATLTVPGLPAVVVSANGRSVAPFVPAVALLGLGGAAALLLVGRFGRRLIGGLVGALAVAAVVVIVNATRNTVSAVSGSLTDAAGISAVPGDASISAAASLWPWCALVGMAVLAACAFAVTVVAWPDRSRRYDAVVPSGSEAPPEDGIGWWDAIERGEDPTVRD